MNPRSAIHLRKCLALAVASVATSTGIAQDKVAPLKLEKLPEETVVLSPFTVSTEKDTGFIAASSLAGGRLATDLRDTPVAYSVVTRDFIDALGLTTVTDAANWSPNTVLSATSNGTGIGDAVLGVGSNYQVRGAGNGQQRNFFPYFSPMEAYSVERYDFSRGPNAVLFGNGGLGGVSSTMTKTAKFGRSITEVMQSIGSWENYRTTIDLNRSLLGDRVAVRLAAVNSDRKGWRDREMDRTHAAFLTTSLKVGPNATLRLEGEYGQNYNTQAFTNINDTFSGWDGKTTFSGRVDTLPTNANAVGIGRRAAGYLIMNPGSGSNTIMSYQNDPITVGGGSNSSVPIGGFVQGALPSFNSSGAMLLYALNVPANRFDNAIAGSAFRLPKESFSMASDIPRVWQRYKDLQLTFDYKVGQLFFQAAADINRNRLFRYALDSLGTQNTAIDINRVLPNGEANTHFLQPYGDGQHRYGYVDRNSQGLRAAVGYVPNSTRFGKYIFNAMGGITQYAEDQMVYNYSIAQNADHRRWGSSGNNLGRTDIVFMRRYWYDTSRPVPAPKSIRYIDPVNGVDKTINPIWALENDRPDSVQHIERRFSYAIASFQAKYFDEKLVLLGAVRGDKFRNYVRQQVQPGEYSATSWDGYTPRSRPDAPADYFGLSYVPKDAAGIATGNAQAADTRPRDANGNRLPQYANDRFKDDYNAPKVADQRVTRTVGTVWHATWWVSPYVNYAETFNAPSAIQRADSSFLQPTVAKGIDVGLRSSLSGGRINVNFSYYTNKEDNNAVGVSYQSDVNTLANANALGDNSVGGRNIRQLAALPSQINDIRSREAKGFELEVVANVTKQWRLTLNGGVPKVWSTNAFPDAIKYLDATFPTLKQIVIDTGGLVDANNVASINSAIPVNDRSPDVSGAVNAYNRLIVSRAGFVTGRQLTQYQPNANIFTDYTMGSGRLRGLRFGAGVQWRGRQIVGNRAADTIVNPANSVTAVDDPKVNAYTPVYSPESYYTVVATAAYTFRLEKRRELSFNLRVNNVLNDRGPIYSSGSTALRPLKGDYTSPARETVPNIFALKQPISFNLSATLKL